MNGCDSSIALPEESEDEFIVFDEGDDLYESMLSATSKAQHTIKLETYIFGVYGFNG